MFSIITVTLNSESTLSDTLYSVAAQRGVVVQHIVKDGGSTDDTIALVKRFSEDIVLKECPDVGIYDAMNQGLIEASGEFVGFLNSDDFFAYDNALQDVAAAFAATGADIVYGDIEMIDSAGKVTRRWRSGPLSSGRLKAKQLPHPAFFVRRERLMQLSPPFDDSYRISADFKQQLLLINVLQAASAYLPKTLVTMRQGGASTADLRAVFRGWKECMRAYREATGSAGWMFVAGKVGRKLTQLLPAMERGK